MAMAVVKLSLFLPFSLFWLSFVCLNFKCFTTTALGMDLFNKKIFRHPIKSSHSDDGFQILNYTQRLDHFNYGPSGDQTFQQRYAINFNYRGGAAQNSPIFFSPGIESSLEESGFLSFLVDNAPRFKALVVYIEVRCLN